MFQRKRERKRERERERERGREGDQQMIRHVLISGYLHKIYYY